MPKYYLRRISEYCDCCTYNYQTFIVEAKDLDHLKYCIVKNHELRNELIGCEWCDWCEKLNDEKSDHECVNGRYLDIINRCFNTEEEFYKYLEEYYITDKKGDILEDLGRSGTPGEWQVKYMGTEDVAYKNFTAGDNPHCECEDKEIGCHHARGHNDFYGLQHYKYLNHTEYGTYVLNLKNFC